MNAIVWAGYPGQSGGTALFDILTGKAAPAGRLPITQYPAAYVDQVPMTDMKLRQSATNPGRTCEWYTGSPVFEFGFGLHYTTFSFAWTSGEHANTSADEANYAASPTNLNVRLSCPVVSNAKVYAPGYNHFAPLSSARASAPSFTFSCAAVLPLGVSLCTRTYATRCLFW